ncbi:Undecaprenyl-phosphate 4-deoxy-4-formamido-L-arabinose transferase [bioreactor metagenome]|uniref:Undecaprenyl-phosphate 4-deoxy-4-formamido-L-arabinose transferase n=1 Tax=bioreactor metagenome TaxID=1076179 RepID=A0A644VWX8_9ZZZZ
MEILDDQLQTIPYPSIMVGIPAYNEEKMVGDMVLQAKKYAHLVLVVNDASSDNTKKFAEEAGALVISHPINKGYGGALLTIFQTAQKYHPDILILMDADGQHDPADIPRFVSKMLEGYEVVVGSRFLDAERKEKIPAYRLFGIKMLDKATHIAAKGSVGISDVLCGYRAFSKKAYTQITYLDTSMHGGPDIIVQLGDLGMKFGEIPVSIRYDLENTSKRGPINMGLELLVGVIQVVVTKRPLLFFGVPGVVLTVGGVILAIQAFDIVAKTGIWSTNITLVAMMMLMLGMLLVITALILYAVAQMIQLVSRK